MRPFPAPTRRQTVQLAAGVAVLFFLLFHELRLYSSNDMVDDAYISLRYADHLAGGLGLVWNRGEPPVEGFTSLLHVALLAGLRRAGMNLVMASQIVGILSSAAAVVLTYGLARQYTDHEYWPLLGPVLLALNPAFAVWARGGMETHLYTLLLLAATFTAVRAIRCAEARCATGWALSSAAAFFLAAQARPEAAALWALLIACYGVVHLLPSQLRDRTGAEKAALVKPASILAFLLPFVAVTAWRVGYFGSLLPNTFYAKTGGGIYQLAAGVSYLMAWASSPAILLVIALAFVGATNQRTDPAVWLLALLIAGSLCIVFLEGGDWMRSYRFVVPILPQLAVLAERGTAATCKGLGTAIGPPFGLGRLARVFLACITIWVMLWPSLSGIMLAPERLLRPVRILDPLDEGIVADFVRIGRFFAARSDADDSIALAAAGAIPYYAGLRTIDMVGLNDRQIAHTRVHPGLRFWVPGAAKGDADYVLSKRPSYILLCHRLTETPREGPDDSENFVPVLDALFKSPGLAQMYEFKSAQLGSHGFVNYYELKEADATDSP